ncbi:hypothetical protein [Kingella sp. (in: b-proteobacteria)]|uniref:hypothetical protein n=1 Tax=Kingella sp. (in: b-proteobacteria) TaxID=2020713 RepID=UPI0026DD5B99|nr:hypothetical protein [Kingella sp. (in: b-proteobacteria)]MDO4658228.1 hypothetical protein [Kingella sp. (in: b-proteobacteria)]
MARPPSTKPILASQLRCATQAGYHPQRQPENQYSKFQQSQTPMERRRLIAKSPRIPRQPETHIH